ncbi:hypothetical protein EJB05_22502 [Eragrostis curvula]|uniref:Uncharacterized protein n=1 Tax=Eragrostis curvula TaxID=38414 RepID=A0A5J9V4M0_9POAL|nr:hypothetical protein EJB05_22502 [Eragrostis curvula]
MPTKDGRQQQEPALHPYEAVRLKQCMQNNARLRQLGLDPIPSSILTTQAAIISNRNKPKDRNGEGSDSEYDPEQDETGEADLSDENTDKDSMASKKSTKTTTKKPRPAKRVLAQQQTTRVTRSKKSLTVQDDASTELSQAEHFTATTEAEEIAPNLTNLSVLKGSVGWPTMKAMGDKYNDEDPNAFDLFKECHYSNKKKGYSPAVQLAIHEMENKISEAVDVDQEPRSVSEVVAAVLAEHTKKSKFLQNVGIESVQPRSSVVNLEQDLAAEKRANAELRLVVDTQREQIDVLSEQLREAEEARVRDKEEMQKRQAETDAKLDFLLSQVQPSRAKE